MDDIDELLKVFECSQWACLPIQVNFINIYQKNIQERDLDSLKLRDSIQKYNEEIAGWKQIQIKFLKSSKTHEHLEDLCEEMSIGIPKNVEDYLFVNQLITKEEQNKLSK